jgi:hypothetical protein
MLYTVCGTTTTQKGDTQDAVQVGANGFLAASEEVSDLGNRPNPAREPCPQAFR